MNKRFRACSLDQPFLLPPSLQDWLPEDHLARFIADVMNELDLSAIYPEYGRKDGRGPIGLSPAAPPPAALRVGIVLIQRHRNAILLPQSSCRAQQLTEQSCEQKGGGQFHSDRLLNCAIFPLKIFKREMPTVRKAITVATPLRSDPAD